MATAYAWPAIARRVVGEHRYGVIELKMLGCTMLHRVRQHHGLYQGSAASPAFFTLTMEHEVWAPWQHIGQARAWGVLVDRGALDATHVGRRQPAHHEEPPLDAGHVARSSSAHKSNAVLCGGGRRRKVHRLDSRRSSVAAWNTRRRDEDEDPPTQRGHRHAPKHYMDVTNRKTPLAAVSSGNRHLVQHGRLRSDAGGG